MTTLTIPRTKPSKFRQRYDKARSWAKNYALPFVKAKSKVYVSEAKENTYTVFGLVCFSSAGFVHSVFSGLLVTGVCWFALELKTRGT